MISAEDIARALRGRRTGRQWVCRCPAHDDKKASLAVCDGNDVPVIVCCHAGCDRRDVIDALKALGLWQTMECGRAPFKPKPKPAAESETDNRGKARGLWQRSQPIQGTLAEIYLRRERGISCPLPATLHFLPGNERYPPAMIAPFVIPDEHEPGSLSVNAVHVDAVHITRLTPDGRKHPDEPNKIMLGPARGLPVVLAPMTDMLGLAITEGIEDALSVHQATGLGVWAAGSAPRLPALAETVPDWTDAVTIFADGDATGENNAVLLAEALDARNIAVEICRLPQVTR
jgi:hypothetical protein